MLLCARCFKEKYFQKRLRKEAAKSKFGPCFFHPAKAGVPANVIASLFDEAFYSNYEIDSADTPGMSLHNALVNLLMPVNDGVTEALLRSLVVLGLTEAEYEGETFYSTSSNYIKSEPLVWRSILWHNFKETILHRQRFFNPDAKKLLFEIFRRVENQKSKTRKCPIYIIEPSASLELIKRARISTPELVTKIKENAERELSSPPAHLCKSGRLNASGISVFYGAFKDETCIAELRAPVGCTVYCGSFKLVRSICVLDTTVFEDPARRSSIFAPQHEMRYDQWLFMREFMQHISNPVLPDYEHLEYIPTQAVAEFLSSHFFPSVDGIKRQIDGIIYSSAQKRGEKNIAIFERAPQEGFSKSEGFLEFISYELLKVTGVAYSSAPTIPIAVAD